MSEKNKEDKPICYEEQFCFIPDMIPDRQEWEKTMLINPETEEKRDLREGKMQNDKKQVDYAFPCGECICNHCANNQYTADKAASEAKKICYFCEKCKWYSGDMKYKSMLTRECGEYAVTNDYAKRRRSQFKYNMQNGTASRNNKVNGKSRKEDQTLKESFLETNSKEVWKKCVSRYGEDAQVDIAIEEMSELIKALLKYRRKKAERQKNNCFNENDFKNLLEDISEETADVIEQLLMIYHNEENVNEWINYKAERQRKRMEGEANG